MDSSRVTHFFFGGWSERERGRHQNSAAGYRKLQRVGRDEGHDVNVSGYRDLRPRSDFWLVPIQTDQGAAGSLEYGECVEYDLGDVQDLPVHPGQIPGDPLGADRRVDGLFVRFPERASGCQ